MLTYPPPTEATQAQMEAETASDTYVTPRRVNFCAGTAKGWIIFNGTGTVAIGDSRNVSSLDDDGTGLWGVNWGTDFSSANHASLVSGVCFSAGQFRAYNIRDSGLAAGNTDVQARDSVNTLVDEDIVTVVAFGDQ